MSLNTVEELVADIRAGKMVILMDDEDRENEGDLVIAATHVRPEDINFMITHARGLVCLTLSKERCQPSLGAGMPGSPKSGCSASVWASASSTETLKASSA